MKKLLVAVVLAVMVTTVWVAIGSEQIGACETGNNGSPC